MSDPQGGLLLVNRRECSGVVSGHWCKYIDVLRGLDSTTVHIVSAAVDVCFYLRQCVFEGVWILYH